MRVQEDAHTWFLAQLKPNCTRIADRNLKRQGFSTFLPMEERTSSRRGKFVNALQPLFPGYLFVAFNIAQGHWRKINATQGVSRLVSFGKAPTPVPQDIIEQLQQRCDDAGKLLPLENFKPGDQVRLSKGPFADLIAEIETISSDQRAWLLMDVMGGQKRVAASTKQLRPAL